MALYGVDKGWDTFLRNEGSPGSGLANSFACSSYLSRVRNSNKERAGFITYGVTNNVMPCYIHIDVYGLKRTIADVPKDLQALSFLPCYARLKKLSEKALAVTIQMFELKAKHSELDLHPTMGAQLLVKNSRKYGPFSPMRYDHDTKLSKEQKAAGAEFKRLGKLYDKYCKDASDLMNETLMPLLNSKYPNRA
jgi:hypothetical protein